MISLFLSNPALPVICLFTFVIHMTESLAYSMRLAGVRTRQIAVALSFVTSTLLISRLSNMFQAPLLGSMVDHAILNGDPQALHSLEMAFRVVICAASLGALTGALLTPTAVGLFRVMIQRFVYIGSIPKLVFYSFYPHRIVGIFSFFRRPKLSMLKTITWKRIPHGFLIFNVFVTSIYCIGVLCSLLAGAYLPEFRATAIQLSGIVNGMATIMFTVFVDPPGARVTDQVVNGQRPEEDIRSVVFFLQVGKILGTLVVSQILFKPLMYYILWVAKQITHFAS